MQPVTLDVVLLLPGHLRQSAIELSHQLVTRMDEQQTPSHFRLGEPYPGRGGGLCEPHVSLFMLSVAESEIPDVVCTVEELAGRLLALDVVGEEYRHNPHGAPELYFRGTDEWRALQHAVIAAAEPLRRGRLRDVDPSGANIQALVDTLPPGDPQREQLVTYGYDEVAGTSPGEEHRFNPHVTFAWPSSPRPFVSLDDLPPPHTFSCRLSELAVYGMSPYGTCTANYGAFSCLYPKRSCGTCKG